MIKNVLRLVFAMLLLLSTTQLHFAQTSTLSNVITTNQSAEETIAHSPVMPPSKKESAQASNVRLIGLDLNEIMIQPAVNGFEWVELKNTFWNPIDVSGYRLSNEEGMSYIFPNLPPLPPDTFVVVIFDGAGNSADETDVSDKRITLHSPPGMVNVLNDQAGVLSLYERGSRVFMPLMMNNLEDGRNDDAPLPWRGAGVPPRAIRDFVAWGTAPTDVPGSKADRAILEGFWQKDMFVPLDFEGTTAAMTGKTIGRYPGRYLYNFTDSDWIVYGTVEVTQGAENKQPTPFMLTPSNGDTFVKNQKPKFMWTPLDLVENYQLQVDDDPNFSSPAISATVNFNTATPFSFEPASNMNYGRYYARVRALFFNKTQSAFSPSVVFTLANTVNVSTQFNRTASEEVQIALPISMSSPGKDTKMLDLHNLRNSQGKWDAPHTKPENAKDAILYTNFNLIQAVAKYYGGNLSQDRIAYEFCKNYGIPELDLCPIKATDRILSWNNAENFRLLLQWALNETELTRLPLRKETADEIKLAIDKKVPVIFALTKKDSAIRSLQSIVVVDFDTLATVTGISGTSPNNPQIFDAFLGISFGYDIYVLIPKSAPLANKPARSDEDINGNGISDLNDDSDGDGVSDFDERNRFKSPLGGLDLSNPDSDGDLVPDKTEIFAYTKDKTFADIDGDGKRNEVDPDSDQYWDDRSRDGCEDANRNGFFDSQATGNNKETSNADPSQEKDCRNPEITISSPASGSKIEACLADLKGEIVSVPNMKLLTAQIITAKEQSHIQLSFSKVSDRYTFNQQLPLFKGRNTVIFNATNEEGGSDQELLVLSCDRAADLHIQLTWSQIGRDVDLHLLRTSGGFDTDDDCYFSNKNPDWGDAGNPDDNPKLDVDCILNCTVENIYFTAPKPGTYTVIAYYYSDKGRGQALPQVTINARGQSYKFGPRALAKSGDSWTVATIDVTATGIFVR
jgi:hypothetical protein